MVVAAWSTTTCPRGSLAPRPLFLGKELMRTHMCAPTIWESYPQPRATLLMLSRSIRIALVSMADPEVFKDRFFVLESSMTLATVA